MDKFRDLTVKDADFAAPMRAKFDLVRKAGGGVDDGMRRYLADVLALDDSVGRLLKRIDDLGLRDNTIVVFSSDHGAGSVNAAKDDPAAGDKRRLNQMGSNGGLRGGKHTMYEGGVRVPFVIRWPGRVPANRVNSTAVVSTIDWLPTLCALAGATIDPARFDGEDVSGIWRGTDRPRAKPLFWKTNNVRSGVAARDGTWKYHHPSRKRGEAELYDLAADPGEARNLAGAQPAVVQRLAAKVEAWNKTLPAEYVKATDQDD